MTTLPSIYKIWNKITAQYYVGSAIDYKKRWRNHITSLNLGIHRNIHLQNAWNKYGANSFEFLLVESFCNPTILLEREQYHIDFGKILGKENLYNINLIAGGFHGRKHSDITKSVMSKKRMGVSLTKGEKNPNSKLTIRKVYDIRNKYATGNYSFAFLGREFGVSYQNISRIIKNKNWK